MGFKRSSQKCKEKFEESKSTITNISYKNYRFLNQVEVLDHNDEVICHIGSADEHNYNKKPENPVSSSNSSDHHKLGVEKVGQMLDVEQFDKNDQVERSKGMKRKNEQKKNKKRIKLETFKGLCEDIVKKMMTSQEEILEKVLEDMVKRDEEKIAKEEVWKKQEMEKMSKELELMAQEQAIAGDRQAQIIEFLMKFRSNPNPDPNGPTSSNPTSTHSRNIPKLIPISSNHQIHPPPQNPKNANPTAISTTCSSRWPRDEVLALINLRCSHIHANDHIDRDHKHLEKSNKGPPLWERISQGMLALGYRRSAKKCKEKWENINKYFRRTKDVNNKIRSRDSKTCPYFDQLSTLDNNSHRPEYRSISSKNCSGLPETVLGASTVHVVEDGDTN